MLCHRPLHTQTHIPSCSALTLSPASSTAEVRGKPRFTFLHKHLPDAGAPQFHRYLLLLGAIYVSWCVYGLFCFLQALTVGPSLDSQPPVRPCFSPTPFIFYNTGSVRNMQRLLSLGQPLHSFSVLLAIFTSFPVVSLQMTGEK